MSSERFLTNFGINLTNICCFISVKYENCMYTIITYCFNGKWTESWINERNFVLTYFHIQAAIQENKQVLCLMSCLAIRQFTSTLVVTSHKINAYSVFASQACLRAVRISMVLRPHDQSNTKDADILRHYQNVDEIPYNVIYFNIQNGLSQGIISW